MCLTWYVLSCSYKCRSLSTYVGLLHRAVLVYICLIWHVHCTSVASWRIPLSHKTILSCSYTCTSLSTYTGLLHRSLLKYIYICLIWHVSPISVTFWHIHLSYLTHSSYIRRTPVALDTVSFDTFEDKRDYILQKRPIILSILLTVAIP